MSSTSSAVTVACLRIRVTSAGKALLAKCMAGDWVGTRNQSKTLWGGSSLGKVRGRGVERRFSSVGRREGAVMAYTSD